MCKMQVEVQQDGEPGKLVPPASPALPALQFLVKSKSEKEGQSSL